MTKEKIKKILFSILVGAITAFLTAFLEGALDALRGTENNILAAGASIVTYLRGKV